MRRSVRSLAAKRLFPSTDIVFVGAKRTPFAKFCSSFKDLTATDLSVAASLAALKQSKVPADHIDHVIIGNVIQSSTDAAYLARHVALRSGLPICTPAVTTNRLCGSGFSAIVDGALLLANGLARAVLVGGTENMTQAPFVLRNARPQQGIALGAPPGAFEDSLWAGLSDSYVGMPMGATAEALAVSHGISGAEVDAFSAKSHAGYFSGLLSGVFRDEIVPVQVKVGKEVKTVEHDENPREGTAPGDFARLPRVFKKKGGVIHAGAASGICDGAASLVMTTAAHAAKVGATPLARFVSFGVAGCPPETMGIGPVPATQQLFARAEVTMADMDLIEVNEAFAPQALAVAKDLQIPAERFNVNGGAIAIGHPLAASGARITAHLIYALKQRGGRLGLGSACIGGGQGMSVLVEAM